MNWHHFSAIAFAIGGIALMFLVARVLVTAMSAHKWPATEATIIESTAERDSDEEAYFLLKLSYRYAVNGKNHVGNQIRVDPGFSTYWGWFARRVAKKYPVGSTVRVYYSPSDHSKAVLQRGVSLLWLAASVGIVYILLANAWNQLTLGVGP